MPKVDHVLPIYCTVMVYSRQARMPKVDHVLPIYCTVCSAHILYCYGLVVLEI